ncbi:MAG TPA: SGNH/GDSL hydrolase family protein [Clostridium sp.]|nr:SGNH/GDSL hydrolase family protein [Clostridium sp.]
MNIKLNRELIEKSVVSRGDTSRILKLFEKARKGEDIIVAFLGGSITQGCNATYYQKCYVELVAEWFREKFRNVNVKHINAGVGATGSLIGVHRADMQVLSKNPDIVFVDAAVNDNEQYFCKLSFESEIRKLLSHSCKPAVIEVFMTMENGVNYQDYEIEIGKQYDVPMISFRNVAKEIIEKNNLKWSALLTDEVHPNNEGHRIIADLLIEFMEKVYKEDYEPGKEILITDKTLDTPCVFGDKYINGKIISNKDLTPSKIEGFNECPEGFQVFQNGWKYESDYKKIGRLVLEVEAKNIILLYKKVISADGGKFTVRINDGENRVLDTYFKDGWGDCTVTEILEENDIKKKYKIDIEVLNEGKSSQVTILGILVS